MKSKQLSLNWHDIKKSVPAILSALIGYYISNAEVVNSILIELGADPKLLVAIFPVVTYIGALFLKGNKNG